ncbi:hypothetical protein F383_17461 [Gossypium arboreum]|uniref:Uncharacterized protein n=1 Tax=Gossypium arboreum TaxID=29729 RepID=A0A0B0NNF9_GOSAR|nr:hypothetical protein F383_17461 [Gossypium arboreum]
MLKIFTRPSTQACSLAV